jgi:hypothetical protein
MNRNHPAKAATVNRFRTTLLDLIMALRCSETGDESSIVASIEQAIRSRSVCLCGIYSGCEDAWAADVAAAAN